MLRADFCLNPPGIHLELPGIDLESPGIPGKNLEFHEKSEKPGITWNWIQILPMLFIYLYRVSPRWGEALGRNKMSFFQEKIFLTKKNIFRPGANALSACVRRCTVRCLHFQLLFKKKNISSLSTTSKWMIVELCLHKNQIIIFSLFFPPVLFQ